jgi:hypothetical protein
MTYAMTSSSSSAPDPTDYFAFIHDFASEPHVSMQQTIGDHIAHLILQPQDLDTPWPIIPGRFRLALAASRTQPAKDLFGSIPSWLRDGIGDQRNLVSESTAKAKDVADHVFLQVSSLDVFADLGISGNIQAGRAPGWDGSDFASQAQWDGALIPAPVEKKSPCVHLMTLIPLTREMIHRPNVDFCRHSPANTYPFVRASTATKTTGDAGRAGSVLGKRARKWYGITRN